MEKMIMIDGRAVPFKASAAIPRLYRVRFGRDIYKDLQQLEKSLGKEGEAGLDVFSLELFENIAYVMARHADNSIPNTPEEWLDGFSTFSIYRIMPQIIQLWGLNLKGSVKPKKNSVPRNGR